MKDFAAEKLLRNAAKDPSATLGMTYKGYRLVVISSEARIVISSVVARGVAEAL